MYDAHWRPWIRVGAAGFLLASVPLFMGCKGDAQLSQNEVQQMKSGPPKEMPAEARAAFQKAMESPQPAPRSPNGK